MNDEDTTPRSGSRWEPEDDAEDTPAAETDEATPTLEQPSEPPTDASATPETTENAPSPDWKERFSGRTALAGAGIGLAAISGVAGFAIGHATGDDSGRVGFVRTNDGDGRLPGPPVGDERDFHGPRGGDLTDTAQPGRTGLVVWQDGSITRVPE